MNKSIIPNTLTITIKTNIPGFQVINYSSENSIPNNKKKENILFSPIFPLKKSVIDSIPQNLKIEEFFNKGLFQSFIFSHGNQSKPLTLLEATKTGIIDNNIIITLDTLFSPNNHFFLNNETYSIADYKWEKGDWRINLKSQSFSENPKLPYSNFKDYKKTNLGEIQLSQLPEDLIFGPNYERKDELKKPIPIATPVAQTNNEKKISKENLPVASKPPPLPSSTEPSSTEPSSTVSSSTVSSSTVPSSTIPSSTVPSSTVPSSTVPSSNVHDFVNLPEPSLQEPLKQDIKLQELKTQHSPITTKQEELVPETNNIQILPTPNLKNSEKSTKKLKDFFGDSKYYFMMNEIIQNMTIEQQNKIFKPYAKLMGKQHYKHRILDSSFYSQLIDQMQVEKNSGGGDCFFIALAEGINLFNSKISMEDGDLNRITYNNYGKSIVFTQKSLRTMVANYILNPKNFEFYQSIGKVNAANLNELFQTELSKNPDKNNYMEILENIYSTNDNFLVEKPNFIPFDQTEYNNPFQPTDQNNTRVYLEGKYYWADNSTIEIINKILFLNVIVLEYNNKNNLLQIPFPNFKTESSFTKYLFLYLENNHYELITFSLKNSLKKAIFDLNKPTFNIPPLYLLYQIFGNFYIQINNQEKQNIKFFPFIMKIFQESFQIIYKKVNKKALVLKGLKKRQGSNEMNYLIYFNEYFNLNPNSVLNREFPFFQEIKTLQGGGSKEENLLSYFITIELWMKKGKEIPVKELKKIKCNQKWNDVEKAYAKFTRKKFVIKPNYEYSLSKNNKTLKQKPLISIRKK